MKKYIKKTIGVWIIMIILITLMYDVYPRWERLGDLYFGNDDVHVGVTDFHVFYYGFESVKNNTEKEMYDCKKLRVILDKKVENDEIGDSLCYLYPPHFAVAFVYLSIFNDDQGNMIWLVGTTILAFIGAIIFTNMIFRKKEMKIYLIMFFLLITSFYFYSDVTWNNSNRLMFFLTSMMFYFQYYKKKPNIAGIFLGLMTVFKVLPMIMVILYFIIKEKKLIKSTIITILASTFIVSMLTGWKIVWSYVTYDFWRFSDKLKESFGLPLDSSIQGIVKTYFPEHNAGIYFIIYLIIIFIVYLKLLKGKINTEQEIMLISLSTLLFSPHMELQHMIVLFFPQIIILKFIFFKMDKSKIINKFIILSMSLSIILLSLNPKSIEHTIAVFIVFLISIYFNKLPIKKNIQKDKTKNN